MGSIRFTAGPALVSALLLLTACVRELPPSKEGPAITFGGMETKAGSEFKIGDSILVWAKDEQENSIMEAQQVTLTEDGWQYSPRKFWPQGQTLLFYAVAPGKAEYFQNDWRGKKMSLYCPDDASEDLMLSDFAYGQEGETIRLSFKHTLSKVSIKGRLRKEAPQTRRVRIKRISIGPFPRGGIWNLGTESSPTPFDKKNFNQDLGKVLTGDEAEILTHFYLYPATSPTVTDAQIEVEWEILYTATGATAFSQTDRISLSQRDFSSNTEILFTLSLDGRHGLIDFADDETKRLCVGAFDTDQDGEISYEEAAAVRDLGNTFKGSTIHSFDELRWFTGITGVPSFAFQNCENLVSIVIPDNVSTIGASAFSGCRSLPSLQLPDTILQIPDGLVAGCSSLSQIGHSDQVTEIGEYAFSGCTSLQSYTLPPSVTRIGVYAFKGSGLTSIDLQAFSYPLSVGIFQNCQQLSQVTLPSNLARIPDQAFQGCTALTTITFPESLSEIGQSSFDHAGLEEIDFPASMTSIEYRAFADCAHVKTIRSRPRSAPTADQEAFGWKDGNGTSHYVGSAVTKEKKFIRLLTGTGYGKEPWSLLRSDAGFKVSTVTRF